MWLAVSTVFMACSPSLGCFLRLNGGGDSQGVVTAESGKHFLFWLGVRGDVTAALPFSFSPTWSNCSRRSVVLHEESAATYLTSTVSCSGGNGRRRVRICSGLSRRLWYRPQITRTMQKKEEMDAPMAIWRMSNLETAGPETDKGVKIMKESLQGYCIFTNL